MLRQAVDLRLAALIGLVALGTLFAIELTRVCVGYLVYSIDLSPALWGGIGILAVILLPIAAIGLTPRAGARRVSQNAAIALIISWGLVQVIQIPALRIVLAAAGIAAWAVLMIVLLTSQRRQAGLGFVLGLALNLGLGIVTRGSYLSWAPSIGDLIGAFVLLALAASLVGLVRWPEHVSEPELINCLPVMTIGPMLALFHLVTGNLGFAQVHANLGLTAAGGAMTIGLALGLIIALLRSYGLTTLPAGGFVAFRFIAFDLIVGGIALWILWSSSDLRLLGLVFTTATSVELGLLALFGRAQEQQPGLRDTAIAFSIGMGLQFALLFIYYMTPGQAVALIVAWLLLGLAAALRVREGSIGVAFQLPNFAAPAGVVIILLVLANGVSLLTMPGEPPNVQLPRELRVMTYNIHAGFNQEQRWNLPETIETIEVQEPDIVILQEVSRGWLTRGGMQQLEWLASELDMSSIWGPASADGLWGNVILTNGAIAGRFVDDFHALDRSAVGARLETSFGLLLTIGTHFADPKGGTGQAQVEQLLGHWDGQSTAIIAGDFNAPPEHDVIQRLLEAGLVDAGAEFPAGTATSQRGERIDYIFVSPDIEVLDTRVIESEASDHRPVVVDLRLPG